MTLYLTPETYLIGPGGAHTFYPIGGQAPYTFEVIAGGAGGTIDSSGIYQAPLGLGLDVIRVTDSLGAIAESEVTVDSIPLTLSPDTLAIAPGLTRSFQGLGGSEPYRYARIIGDAGWIDADTGLFNSGSDFGASTIQVIDNLGAEATAKVLVASPLQLVCDIIQKEMGLADGRVYLWDQKIFSPSDEGVFVVVGELTNKAFGSTCRTESDDFGCNEVQSVNMRALLSVDVISRGNAARNRKEEVLLAIASTYSQQQQEVNSFRVYPISTNFINLSRDDGAAIPYRFNLTVALQYFVSKTKAIPFFDVFSDAEITTEP